MPSPFPGMDPYIEGQLWPDFHHDFITELRRALLPALRPRYLVLIQEHVYVERGAEELRRRSIRLDTAVAERASTDPVPSGGGAAIAVMPGPIKVTLPLAGPEEMRPAYLEVRRADTRELITVIEVLSPDNKRPRAGLEEYLHKRSLVLRSPIHLVEIDLLRGGARLPMGEPRQPADYYVFVSRAPLRPDAEVWPFTLRHRLPAIQVPLAEGDPDVPLDLQAVFDAVYDQAGYDYSLDYSQPPLPPISVEDAEWARSLLQTRITA